MRWPSSPRSYHPKVLLLSESQLFHSGRLLVSLIYTLTAALAWFAPPVTNEPGCLEQECHPLRPQGSALAFPGMHSGGSLSWGKWRVALGTPVANSPNCPHSTQLGVGRDWAGGKPIILLNNGSHRPWEDRTYTESTEISFLGVAGEGRSQAGTLLPAE